MTIEPFWTKVNEVILRQGDYLPSCLVPIPLFDPENFSKSPEGQEIDVEVRELDLVVLHGNGKLVDWKLQLLQPPQ